MNETCTVEHLPERAARKILINGIVQGVGFRPFVFQQAKKHGLCGEVSNTSRGVSIHVEGESDSIEEFCRDLTKNPPPLATITDFSVQPDSFRSLDSFDIVESTCGAERHTLISPDVCICRDCLHELFDPEDRRYRYPFINCTNCGPRYTIIEDIPYDRPKTSMKHFPMCPSCLREYHDPENRRFHAQPNACPACGPHITLYRKTGQLLTESFALESTVRLLKDGAVVAIKGLGGFHLAADAENDDAVLRLRQRKRREQKPLALMALDTDRVARFAKISPEEHRLLTSPQRPIVLLEKQADHTIAPSVSPSNQFFGVMLPYTPLHYLLLSGNTLTALVMTSANLSEEPIVIDNAEAFSRLSGIADYLLVHDRDIYLRSDDSIVRQVVGNTRFIRRSRGYVPAPVFLKKNAPSVLGCGAEIKNTVCLIKKDQAFLSQHIGDMENLATFEFFEMTVNHLKRILNIVPEVIACDLHPDYLSTRWALNLEKPVIRVQHHFAHIASCLAENRQEGPVIGISLDGTGFGEDGCIWGGEVLVADTRRYRRAAHLEYAPMPGGAAAIKAPWRMAASYLYHVFGDDFFNLELPLFRHADREKMTVIVQMIRKSVNAPLTSSLGRLFDGVSAILGIRGEVGFEGQAAMELEMMAAKGVEERYPVSWTGGQTRIVLLEPIIREIVSDSLKGIPVHIISARFHNTVIRLFCELCLDLRKETGIQSVALSGGAFQNGILLDGMIRTLRAHRFSIISHRLVPSNDGGISLGQAVVAASRIEHGEL
jgi:hydrogenase maturation protein HypF